jgi:hypothetical protein
MKLEGGGLLGREPLYPVRQWHRWTLCAWQSYMFLQQTSFLMKWEEQWRHFINLSFIYSLQAALPWLPGWVPGPVRLYGALCGSPKNCRVPRLSQVGKDDSEFFSIFFMYNLLTVPLVLQLQAVSHLECPSQVRIFPAEIETAAPRHVVRQIAATWARNPRFEVVLLNKAICAMLSFILFFRGIRVINIFLWNLCFLS